MINTTFRERYATADAAAAIARSIQSGVITDTHDRTISVPRAVAEGLAGGLFAVVGAVFKTVPGAIQGAVHATRAKTAETRPCTGVYTVTTLAEAMAAGATIGTAAGPVGTAVGLGAGFLVGVIGRVAESRAKTAKDFVQNVDTRVETYLAFNGNEDTHTLRKAVDGLQVGATSGFRQGLAQGWDAGVSLIDATGGALINLKDALFGK